MVSAIQHNCFPTAQLQGRIPFVGGQVSPCTVVQVGYEVSKVGMHQLLCKQIALQAIPVIGTPHSLHRYAGWHAMGGSIRQPMQFLGFLLHQIV